MSFGKLARPTLTSVITAYEKAQTGYAKDCFLDILTDMPYDERTYYYVMETFYIQQRTESVLCKLSRKNREYKSVAGAGGSIATGRYPLF